MDNTTAKFIVSIIAFIVEFQFMFISQFFPLFKYTTVNFSIVRQCFEQNFQLRNQLATCIPFEKVSINSFFFFFFCKVPTFLAQNKTTLRQPVEILNVHKTSLFLLLEFQILLQKLYSAYIIYIYEFMFFLYSCAIFLYSTKHLYGFYFVNITSRQRIPIYFYSSADISLWFYWHFPLRDTNLFLQTVYNPMGSCSSSRFAGLNITCHGILLIANSLYF